MYFSRLSKYPKKNELLTQTLGVPNRVDKLTCPSIAFKQHVQRLQSVLFF